MAEETREGLALHLCEQIARTEGRQIGGKLAGRNYVLDLLADVVQAIDGGRPTTARKIDRTIAADVADAEESPAPPTVQ